MTFLEFCEVIKKEIEERVGSSSKINIRETIKNNGEKLTGLSVLKNNTDISPVIYLEFVYEDYKNGYEINELIEKLMDLFSENENPNLSFDAKDFLDFKKQKDKIGIRLINSERNQELLKNIPHIDFLDLSIIFICMVKNNDEEVIGSITIENDHLNVWDVTRSELYELAKENMKRELPVYTQSLHELFTCLGASPEDNMLIMVSNQENYFGAASILYDNVLERLSIEHNTDLFVIPSSVHELLVFPISSDENFEERAANCKETILSVNENEVSQKDFLSNNLYFYNKTKKTLKIVS